LAPPPALAWNLFAHCATREHLAGDGRQPPKTWPTISVGRERETPRPGTKEIGPDVLAIQNRRIRADRQKESTQ